ncbi:hypothetical protein IJM86_07230 [bacterium]|nr:hypothetical protein [bacterium]
MNLLAQNIKSPESVNELPSLNQQENFIYKRAKCMGVTDKGQIAYILATVKGECSFKNIREIGC